MLSRRVSEGRAASLVRWWTPLLVASSCVLAVAPPAAGQTSPAITVGGGVRTSFTHNEPDEDDSTDTFALDSARLYLGGSVTPKIKFMFNTEYNGATNDVGILDAVGRFEYSPKFNIWVGRFLPPSDRANLYGPYYASHWGVFSDGVQDGYPFIFQGRDNGAMYWGQFDKVKVSFGAFDYTSDTGDDTVLGAGRVQIDFWDSEDGYYLNGTYYGDKNLLAIGGATQFEGSDKTAYSVDFLLEKKVGMGGAATVEAEWARYDGLGGYSSNYVVNDGSYILGAFLFPQMSGEGRFQILGKYAFARFSEGLTTLDPDYNQKTTEINLNYIIKQFNARIMGFYKDTRFDAVRTNFWQIGVGLQFQI